MSKNTQWLPLILLPLILLLLTSFMLGLGQVLAKESGSFIVNVSATTTAWDETHPPAADADKDSKSQPFWATVEVSSTAGGGHGWAWARSYIRTFWARATGNSGGSHDGAGGDWDADYHPEGASTGEPFKILPGNITMKVIGTLAKSNITLTIFDSTLGTYAFNGAIYLNGGGNSPVFYGSFSPGYFSVTYGPEPSTSVVLTSPIYVTIPKDHDYTYTGGAGGSAEHGQSSVDFSLWVPDVPYGPAVGGILIPVDKFALLAPYIGVASTIIVAAVATAIYVKRVKHRKEKQ